MEQLNEFEHNLVGRLHTAELRKELESKYPRLRIAHYGVPIMITGDYVPDRLWLYIDAECIIREVSKG